MLRRILLVAKRDYISSVMSKAYLIGLLVLPVMLGASMFFVSVANRGVGKPQRIALIDHTGVVASAVVKALDLRSRAASTHYTFEEVKPEQPEDAQLLSLCDRIRNGELFLVLDIPADLGHFRYYTNSTSGQLNAWLSDAVNDGVRRARLTKLGLDQPRVAQLMAPVSPVSMNLVTRDGNTGRIGASRSVDRLQTVLVPFLLVMLLLVTVMTGSSQKLGAIAEDKMQRVFEMLMVSVSPVEIMMGKVLAALGVSLTGSVVHIAVGIGALVAFATPALIPLHLLPWFFTYLLFDVVMLSAMGAALGSACSTPQDAQGLQFFMFLPVLIPVLTLAPIMQQPNGPLATFLSFFPPFTPLIMLLRQALPGGVPWWQPWLGLAGVAVCAVFITWAAARVFRIGILSQGKTPRVSELIQWIVRG